MARVERGISGSHWQNEILLSLQARDANERVHAEIIEGYRRLANQTAILKERNRNLLKAAASASDSLGTASSGTRVQGGSPAANANGSDNNPVRQAYVTSLESQLSSLREELSSLYKTQAQNAQRLVHLTESLQTTSTQTQAQQSELLSLRSQVASHAREKEESIQLRKEKDRSIEHLQDELSMVRLEMDMIEKRNEELQEDNSSLLKRWLEKKAQEARDMDKMLEQDSSSKKKDEPTAS